MHPSTAARLLRQVLDSKVRQYKFQPAEVELLLEVVEHPRVSRRTLRHYQQKLARDAENGKALAVTLSEYLRDQQQRRLKRTSLLPEPGTA